MRVGKILVMATAVLAGCHHGGGAAPVRPAAPTPEAAAPVSAPRPLGAVAPRSPADPVPGTESAAAPMAPANTASLYMRLGGIDAIRAVVHDFRARVAADDRINGFFRGVNLDSLEQLIGDQICQTTGGPCVYGGRTMLAAHTGLNIHDADFNALVEDLTAALDHFNVPAREKNELLTALASMKGDIVGH